MINYNCPLCEKIMFSDVIEQAFIKIDEETPKYYKCDDCKIGIVEPGYYYKDQWTMWIDVPIDQTTIWIEADSFEDCIKKWKLKVLW